MYPCKRLAAAPVAFGTRTLGQGIFFLLSRSSVVVLVLFHSLQREASHGLEEMPKGARIVPRVKIAAATLGYLHVLITSHWDMHRTSLQSSFARG